MVSVEYVYKCFDVLCMSDISGDQFCNAIIHGELTSDGQPLRMHTTSANSTHPAIISCWIKYLDSSSTARYNPVLRLLMTKREIYEIFPAMPADSKDLYKIDLDYVQPGSYYNLSFEYTIHMYDERMDYTVATCGIIYHSSTANQTECWSPTFTLIKYDSIMDSSTTEDEIITSVPPDIATTEGTTVTDKATTTTGSNGDTTTRESRQTSDESKIPPTTRTIPATPSPPTATLASVSLLSGFGTGTSVLVLLVIILVLVIGILWTKLRTTSADMKILQATCDQLSTRANEKALEGEQPDDENPVQNTN